MVRAIMHGCNGAMGRFVCAQANVSSDIQIVAGVDVSVTTATFPTFENILRCDMPADVIIDFSTAQAVNGVVEYALEKKLPIVVCTTGLEKSTLEKLDSASKTIPVFLSANMSLGVNLMTSLAKKAASILSSAGFDIEIIEKHHNQKVDAPSGTALMIGNAINNQLEGEFNFVFDRSQTRNPRNKKEIGIHALRGGTIVGEHTVVYAGKDEIFEITHKATSKEVFAVGAIKAATFLVGKAPGKYDMNDIIGGI